ncbi:hypothetical protein GpartN1_g1987.t1 [Galdieria partita]|uniref:Major facilitator superfamily (MFS) profile domain-containing protein n=1 Tax=Galdieria partita TaxID=83374 RepID=A0A9C7UP53_9RHOD|nr:hypothetical protein GpartN1_g1987.t1 [Galdieria partita]
MTEPVTDIAPDIVYRISQEADDVERAEISSQDKNIDSVAKGGNSKKSSQMSSIKFNALGTALGFLVNGYMYQVGSLLLTLYEDVYPTVYNSSTLQSALSTAVLYGVLFGLIAFGFIADIVGRKAGLIMCSSLVILGSILSVAANGTSTDGMMWMIVVSRAVVGLGMGGEYTCNVPNVMEDSEDVSVNNRGRRVSLLVMFMEVVGNNTPTLIQLILIAAACRNVTLDSRSSTGVSLPGCHPQVVWRLSYGLGLIPCVIVLLFRVRMSDSAMYQTDARLRKKLYDGLDLFVILRHFSSRGVGTIVMWLIVDWINYSQGNFSGVILEKVTGVSLFKTAWIGLVQGVIFQSGPFIASLVVDKLGRRNTEIFGWMWLASTQLINAGIYIILSHHPVGFIVWQTFVFIFQYFVFIPVYLIPAEVYPTRIRATMYGWSSGLGKVGGILGTTLFPYMWKGFGHGVESLDALRDIQWFYAGLEYLGLILAILFVPEYSKTSLRGEDRRYNELRRRYAARFAKSLGVINVTEAELKNASNSSLNLYTLLKCKLQGSQETYLRAKQEYAKMLLSRCYFQNSEEIENYADLPIYYDDRTLITKWIRQWRMGRARAAKYIENAEKLGLEEDNSSKEESNKNSSAKNDEINVDTAGAVFDSGTEKAN